VWRPIWRSAKITCGSSEGIQRHLVFEASSDDTLHGLLTKRFVKTKQYTPQAVKTFTKLVELAGLPVHKRRSNKNKLILGAGPSPQLLVTSKRAGNTGVDVEIFWTQTP